MADPKVVDLVQGMNRLIIADLGGGRSLAADDQLIRMVTRSQQRYLEPLANNRGLEPGGGQARAWAALREVAAGSAMRLARKGPLPEQLGEDDDSGLRRFDRDQFEIALCRLDAATETEPLVTQKFPAEMVAELGPCPPPVFYRDEMTASTIVAAIAEQTSQDEKDVRRTLVAAGYGARGATAARMLLDVTPGFATLPEADQEVAVELVADELHSGLARPTGDIPPTRPELAGDLEDDPVRRGQVAVAWANYMAAFEIERLHEELREDAQAAVLGPSTDLQPKTRVELPQSVYDLMRGVDAEVRERIPAGKTMWSGEFAEWGLRKDERIGSTSWTFRVRPDDAVLTQLTRSGAGGSLRPENVVAAREAIDQSILIYAKWAVPDKYHPIHKIWADALEGRFDPMEKAVLGALVQNERNGMIDRLLPSELAQQLRTEGAPSGYEQYAPAAQGLADAVYSPDPDALIRRLAAEGPQDMGMTAADVLVAGSAIPPEDRQVAAWVIGEKINDRFEVLPARLEEWKGSTVLPAAELSREYGEEIGLMAQGLVVVYANDPDRMRRDVAAAEQKLAAGVEAARPGMPPELMEHQLLPGLDEALRRHHPETPGVAPAATRAAAAGQSTSAGLNR